MNQLINIVVGVLAGIGAISFLIFIKNRLMSRFEDAVNDQVYVQLANLRITDDIREFYKTKWDLINTQVARMKDALDRLTPWERFRDEVK